MTVRGHIENGAIVLDEDVSLPEGATVKIEFVKDDDLEEFRKTLHPEMQRWFGILDKAPNKDRLEDEYKQHLVDKYLR